MSHDKVRSNVEPIAIIGIGCRFPNGVNSPESFWRLLQDQVDAITDLPSYRVGLHPVPEPVTLATGKTITFQGGYLNDIDQFDPYFFGLSPREAIVMDPQHRLLMEVAWEAMMDAGQVPEKMPVNQTGVFIGLWANDYADYMAGLGDLPDLHAHMGGGRYCASGRLSYFLNSQGPSLTVDSACSSSLVAIHLACESLQSGDSSMALAGGANVILHLNTTLSYARSQMLSFESRCKFGDASANGFVRSEGAGVVVLKRLSDALKDNDPIYAVIRGTACNNDGHSDLFVMPSIEGQRAVLIEAYQKAGISPGRVAYIEAHGPGTGVGDPVELTAIGNIVGEGRSSDRPCIVGSVKTNIGHTEAAAGVAGLIKAVLSLNHRSIPGNNHFHNPNPNIAWDELPITIPRELTQWPDDSRPAIAGVSSFGITGTNAHVVLEEYCPEPVATEEASESGPSTFLFPVSAHTPDALKDLAERYVKYLDDEEKTPLRDICYTAGARRSHHQHRLCVVGHDYQELQGGLQSYVAEEAAVGVYSGRKSVGQRPKVAFIFPGQGSQWLGMGRELLQREAVFRRKLEECEAAMRPYQQWSLIEELQEGKEDGEQQRIDVVQPQLFALQVGLAELWRSWGVEPDAVVGHSMGEVAAACVSGVLSLEAGAQVICQRSQLLRRLSGRGAMAVVELSAGAVAGALGSEGGLVSVAAVNSWRTTVISGERAAIKRLVEKFGNENIYSREVKVDVASHSREVEEIGGELREQLAGLRGRRGAVAMYSTVTGAELKGEEVDGEYWVRNVREEVRFAAVLEELKRRGYGVYVEVSAHPVLLPAIEEVVRGAEENGAGGAVVVGTLRKELSERQALLESVGQLYASGVEVDWEPVNGSGRCVKLPSYPWQRQRYWVEGSSRRRGHSVSESGHPLLGRRFQTATDARQHFWELGLDLARVSYLKDHRVNGVVVVPATAYIEMALAGAEEAFGSSSSYELEEVAFEKMLILNEDDQEEQIVQLVMELQDDQNAVFQFFGQREANSVDVAGKWQPAASGWTLFATGRIKIASEQPNGSHLSLEEIRSKCNTPRSVSEHYEQLRLRALEYGPAFQAVSELWTGPAEVLATLQLGEGLAEELQRYRLHPVLLDACFQTLISTMPASDEPRELVTYLPVGVESVRRYGRLDGTSRHMVHVVRRSANDNGGPIPQEVQADVYLLDESGELKAEALGLRARRVGAGRGDSMIAQWFYQLQWRQVPKVAAAKKAANEKYLILADREGVGEQLAEQLQAADLQAVLVYAAEEFEQRSENVYAVDPMSVADFVRVLREVGAEDLRVVHLWNLDLRGSECGSGEELMEWQRRSCGSVLHLLQALGQGELEGEQRLWVVTRAAQPIDEAGEIEAGQSAVWGLGRVIGHEHPQYWGGLIDLDGRGSASESAEQILKELGADGKESQVGYRGGERYALRLVRAPHGVNNLNGPRGSVNEKPLKPVVDQPFRLEITKRGTIDNLVWRAVKRIPPGPGQVEIEIMASGLNFHDVLNAMGAYLGLLVPIGVECSGVISAVGEGVEEFKVGDEVVSFSLSSFAAFVTTDTDFVVHKPAHLTLEQAASTPLAFMTAHYALNYVGRLRKGERVLIHSATGGVGLAAVQLAQREGAEVFATAGSEEKREYLRTLGINHVMNSRTLDFARQIMEITDGQGVDVVLNSLPGAAIGKNFEVLASYGRFLEIGKRDIYENTRLSLWPFHKNLSYSAIDFVRIMWERPRVIKQLLEETVASLNEGTLTLLPLTQFRASEIGDAFRLMAQAKHIGKIVVQMQQPEISIIPADDEPVLADSDKATYLITGGMGGLGLEVAKWLVKQGAKDLLLVGRSAPSQKALAAIAEMSADGATVECRQTDVADASQTREMIEGIEKAGKQLGGIIHAAGVLDDGVLLGQTWERFERVMRSKVMGAWNLSELTREKELDFFVLFSSAASVLGSPGQGNYAAANAYLDGLAAARQRRGEAGLSINWGPWAEVGLAAREDRARHVAGHGMQSMKPADAVAAFEQLMKLRTVSSMTIMPFDIDQWGRAYPQDAELPLFSELARAHDNGHGQTQSSQIRQALLSAKTERHRRSIMDTHIRQQVAKVLRIAPAQLDINTPLKSFGLDSLMALELRNLLESSFQTKLSATAVWNYPTIAALTSHLAEKIEVPLTIPEAVEASEIPNQSEVHLPGDVVALEHLSEKEMADLLAQQLARS